MGYHVSTNIRIQQQKLIRAMKQDMRDGNQGHYNASQINHHTTGRPSKHGEGNFSSAFGHMSLEDQNALADLASHGAPFFSSAAMNMPPGDPDFTPTANRQLTITLFPPCQLLGCPERLKRES
jgi:hypothetical protein